MEGKSELYADKCSDGYCHMTIDSVEINQFLHWNLYENQMIW